MDVWNFRQWREECRVNETFVNARKEKRNAYRNNNGGVAEEQNHLGCKQAGKCKKLVCSDHMEFSSIQPSLVRSLFNLSSEHHDSDSPQAFASSNSVSPAECGSSEESRQSEAGKKLVHAKVQGC